jgi:hypothetical protein
MKIQENQQQEQELAVQFKTLALDLFQMISLPKSMRVMPLCLWGV